MKKIALASLVLLIMLLICSCETTQIENNIPTIVMIPEEEYTKALAFLESGEYQKAYDSFSLIKDYKDSTDYLSKFSYKMIFCLTIYPSSTDETNGNFSERKYEYDNYGNPLKSYVLEGYFSGDVREITYNQSVDYENTFDEKGRLVKSQAFDGTSTRTTTYTYDDNGQILEKQSTRNGQITHYELYKNGNLIEEASYRYAIISKDIFRIYYEYDENNNLIKEVHPDTYSFTQTFIYKYDENGNKIKITEIHQDRGYDEKIYSERYYEYDVNNKLISDTLFLKGEFNNSVTYDYDIYGNKTQKTSKSIYSENISSTWKYEYDVNANIISTTETTDGIVYEYDKYGNLIKETATDRSFSYEYKLFYNPNAK